MAAEIDKMVQLKFVFDEASLESREELEVRGIKMRIIRLKHGKGIIYLPDQRAGMKGLFE